jgi:hypothetical protein
VSASLPVPTEPTSDAGAASGSGSDAVSLREFARLVPMPEATARNWQRAGLIAATQTATGRYRVPLRQLDEVRRKLGMPAPEGAAR